MSLNYKSYPAKSHARFLSTRLRHYNRERNKYFKEHIDRNDKPFGFYAYDKTKKVGGICGWIDRENWAFIAKLYVEKNYRDNDAGSTLIQMVEEFAKKNKCVGMYVRTYDYQSPEFYKKKGFDVFGILEDHPIGATHYFMKKKL